MKSARKRTRGARCSSRAQRRPVRDIGIDEPNEHVEQIAIAEHEVYVAVPVGTRIVVEVKSLYAMDNYGVIEGIVKTGDRILFKAVIQAMRLNDDVA